MHADAMAWWRWHTTGACHRWAPAIGTDSPGAGTWQSAAEPALDPFLAGLAGPEIVTGMGLARTYTRLYPEQIILDDDLYQRARHSLQAVEVNDETLALDVIATSGRAALPGREAHPQAHAPRAPGLTHELDDGGNYRDPLEVARERVRWIRNHHPEPLEAAKRPS